MKPCLSSLLLFAIFVVCAGNLQAEEPPNLASTSDLPQGNGMAANFVADVGIDGNPKVVFHEEFEKADYQKRWSEVNDKDSTALKIYFTRRGMMPG